MTTPQSHELTAGAAGGFGDGIASLAWSTPSFGAAQRLVVGSWDGTVRIFNAQQSGGSEIARKTVEQPVLTAVFGADNSVLLGGCDNNLYQWQTSGGDYPLTQIGSHQAPIKQVLRTPDANVVISVGWDHRLNMWDVRRPNSSAISHQLPERAYCADMAQTFLVVGCADRQLCLLDINNPSRIITRQTTLKYQTRSVAVMPEGDGFLVGSIEGRCAVEFNNGFDRGHDGTRSFIFKCHRNGNDIYAVNALSFNGRFGSFATAGSDGTFSFWDYRTKSRIKGFTACPQPISAAAFSPDSSMFAFTQSYDWSRGSAGYNPSIKSAVHIMPVAETDIKPRNRN